MPNLCLKDNLKICFQRSTQIIFDIYYTIFSDLLTIVARSGRFDGVWRKHEENTSRDARTTKSRKPSAVKPKHLRTRRTLKSESFHEKLFHTALTATTFHSEKLRL